MMVMVPVLLLLVLASLADGLWLWTPKATVVPFVSAARYCTKEERCRLKELGV